MRATKKQNEIIKAYFKAFDSGQWTAIMPTSSIRQATLDGGVYEAIWEHIVEYNVSVTSQLMMSADVFKHISKTAKSSIRKGFITFLNNNNIK